MGSFQQILMGATCLVAAFFFGSYLHNRPATNEMGGEGEVASADPLESIFAFGNSKSQTSLVGPNSKRPEVAASPSFDSRQVVGEVEDARQTNAAIETSERIPSAASFAADRQPVKNAAESRHSRPANSQQASESSTAAIKKPVVPDFSELASRFRNTPLQLTDSKNNKRAKDSVIHESERVRGFDTSENAPVVVIRKPQKLTPLQDFAKQVDRMERQSESFDTGREVAGVRNTDQHRWRVNRSKEIDQFRDRGLSPEPDAQPRRTIDDIVAEDSANYLLKSDENTSTYATDPIRDDWAATQRREITRQAADRSRDILDIDDPGNRFHSVLTSPEPKIASQSFGSPQPDFETDYYAPAKPDPAPIRSQVHMQRIPRQNNNWKRRSNVQSDFRSNAYRIQPGDTLQSISVRFYGVPDHYLDLYKANRNVLDRITSSPEGVVIEIPKLNN